MMETKSGTADAPLSEEMLPASQACRGVAKLEPLHETAEERSQAAPPSATYARDTDVRFRTVADTAPVLLWMARADGQRDFFNQGWLSFTGRSQAEEIGTGWAESIHPEDFPRCMQMYIEAFVERRAFSLEYRLRRHDGAYRWVFDQGAPRFDDRGGFEGLIGSCVDVTEQREAREALGRLTRVLEERVRERTALASERALLIREVHHRVKNDLQLISSLLSIQGRTFGDSAAARAFEECQARVQAIAQIHEHMYQSEDLARMSLSDHLRTLASHVARGVCSSAVELAWEGDECVIIPVDRAIPCAMIVHELVFNALEHAFPNERQGRVALSCRRDASGEVRVIVADDGVGMPCGPKTEARGLGWTLIETFARQLRASLQVDASRGTRVELCFSDSAQSMRAPRPGGRECSFREGQT